MKIVVCGSEQPRCEEVQQLLRKALIARWPRPEIHLFTPAECNAQGGE